MPSGRRLIWKKLAPLTTVVPLLNSARGMPTASQASSTATPQGSRGGIVMMWTGPLRPWWSPGASLVSIFVKSRYTSSEPQPAQPKSRSQESRSSLSRAQKAMQLLWELQPPSTLARACRMKLLPFSCGSTG